MFSKLTVSLSAAVALFAAAGVARAAPVRTSDDVRAPASNAAIYAAEAGNPDSVEYGSRMVSDRSVTNQEINASQAGSADSIDNRDQQALSNQEWQAAWQALESGHPDFV